MVNPGKKSAQIICLTMLIAILTGCASHKDADVKAVEARRIVNVFTSENPESINVFIEGNQSLIYSAVKQVSPRGVVLSFPDTAINNLEPVYTPPDNEIISSITMRETGAAEATRSSIFIALKADTPYKMTRGEAGLQISFARPRAKSAKKITEPERTSKSMPTATRLETVTATALDNKLVVNILADGAIKDYISFTLDSPPRIVFDMFNIKSPYKGEQKIAVKSKWADRVRHFGYPDKVRLVLDTYEDYLSNYSAATTEKGLTIQVGVSTTVQPDSD